MATKRTQKPQPAPVGKKKVAPPPPPPEGYNELVLTRDGERRIQAELEGLYLTRKDTLERVREALQYGEPAENTELDEAKAQQAAVDSRILELQRILKNARVIDGAAHDGCVHVGSTVRIKEVESGEEIDYHIVGAMEADPLSQRISNLSPVGQALLGRKAGDKVTVTTPMGSTHFIIVSVE